MSTSSFPASPPPAAREATADGDGRDDEGVPVSLLDGAGETITTGRVLAAMAGGGVEADQPDLARHTTATRCRPAWPRARRGPRRRPVRSRRTAPRARRGRNPGRMVGATIRRPCSIPTPTLAPTRRFRTSSSAGGNASMTEPPTWRRRVGIHVLLRCHIRIYDTASVNRRAFRTPSGPIPPLATCSERAGLRSALPSERTTSQGVVEIAYKTLVRSHMRYTVHDRHGGLSVPARVSTAARKLAPRDRSSAGRLRRGKGWAGREAILIPCPCAPARRAHCRGRETPPGRSRWPWGLR